MNRNRRLLVGIATSGLSRALGAIAPLITVPVSLKFLGASGYGAWAAALALTSFATFADLGIGAGLMTKLSNTLARHDMVASRCLVSSAYVALTSMVAIALLLLWLSRDLLNWATIVAGEANSSNSTVEIIALITISGYILNVIASLIVRIQYASQQIGLSNLWQTAGSLVGIGTVFLAASESPGPSVFIVVAVFTPIIIAVANTVTFFLWGKGRNFRPVIGSFHIVETGELASIGSRFLLINVLMAMSLGIDSWIVAHTSALADVPNYAIPTRIFALVGTLVAILSIPLWPTTVEALTNRDIDWVRRTTRRMTWLTPLLVGGISLAAMVFVPPALRLWLGGFDTPSIVLLLGLALWNIAQALVAPIFMVQNAAGVLKPQIIGYTVLLVAIPLKWQVAESLGYSWLPIASTACYLVIIGPAAWTGYRRSIEPRHDIGRDGSRGDIVESNENPVK